MGLPACAELRPLPYGALVIVDRDCVALKYGKTRGQRIGNLKLTFAERAVYWMVWRGTIPAHYCNCGYENMST